MAPRLANAKLTNKTGWLSVWLGWVHSQMVESRGELSFVFVLMSANLLSVRVLFHDQAFPTCAAVMAAAIRWAMIVELALRRSLARFQDCAYRNKCGCQCR